MSKLEGMCVPICTPFDATGEKIDEPMLLKHVDNMVDAGVHIILTCGGTGEFAYLRSQERKHIHEVVARHLDGNAKLVMQTSAISTAEAIELTRHAEDLGADAAMVLPPYFEGPDMAGVHDHYERIAAATSVPLMVYNIPQHSGIDITAAEFSKLLEIDSIEYIKDSTGDFVRIQELIATGGSIFNGADPLAFYALMAGCQGCVWGAINALPAEAVELWDLVSAGDLAQAQALWARILPSQLYFWNSVYNAAVKAAVAIRGESLGPCRIPVQPLADDALQSLREALAPMMNQPVSEHKVAV
jgi:4-hydroxy-tetrahydrodipicolinate synthase